MRRAALLLLGLLLAGCVSSPDGSAIPQARAPQALVRYGPVGMDKAGWTFSRATEQLIEIKPGQDPITQRRVLAHELLHVAGYRTRDHSNDPACYFFSAARRVLPEQPCPYELDLIRRVGSVFHVATTEPRLSHDLQWAVDFWNRWAGHTVFVVK